MLNSPTCIIALYLKDAVRIKENCAKVYTVKSKVPIIKHLFENNWLLSTFIPFKFVTMCPDRVTETEIGKGVKVFKQAQGCHLSSKYFVVSTQLSQEGETSVTAKKHFESEIELSKFLIRPQQFLDLLPESGMHNESLKPMKYLEKIKALPVANLHALLQSAAQQVHSVNQESNYASKAHFNVSFWGIGCRSLSLLIISSKIFLISSGAYL